MIDLKNSKVPQDVRNSSNLWRSLHRPAHQFNFSNTVDDPIKVEEVEDPFESGEHGSTFGEEASSEEDSKDISSALGKTKMAEDSLDEKATTVGEGKYVHTSPPTPSLVCFPLYLSFAFFIFPYLIFSISPGFTEIIFSNRGEDRFIFVFVFPEPYHYCSPVL